MPMTGLDLETFAPQAATRYAHLLGEAHTDISAVNTATETVLAQFTLPTNLAVGDVVEFFAAGDLLNSSGSSVTYLWKVKVGTTAALTTNAGGVASNASRRKWNMMARLRVTATSAQGVSGKLAISSAQSATFADGSITMEGYGSAAEDLTSAKDVTFTVTMGTAVSTADAVCHGAHLVTLGKAA